MKPLRIFLVLLILSRFNLYSQSLTVDQLADNKYNVAVPAFTSKDKLVWTSKPDSWKNAQPLVLKSANQTIELSSTHPILKLQPTKGKPYYAAPRGIKLEGANNFRDLGGYPTKDGKQVKWGKIFRSADISKLTDADVKIVSDLNIKMVCDLRGEKEVEIAPDRLPEGTNRILLSAGSENVGGANGYAKYMKTPESADSLLKSFYRRTDHLGKKYKPMFDELLKLESDQALLFHCTAGKDRTGVGAALILFALGVDESFIYADYEATNEFRKDHNEQFIASLKQTGLSESAAKSMMAAKPEYLKETFKAIDEKYGTIDSFLEKEMGLTPAARTALQKKFLY